MVKVNSVACNVARKSSRQEYSKWVIDFSSGLNLVLISGLVHRNTDGGCTNCDSKTVDFVRFFKTGCYNITYELIRHLILYIHFICLVMSRVYVVFYIIIFQQKKSVLCFKIVNRICVRVYSNSTLSLLTFSMVSNADAIDYVAHIINS